MQILLRALMVSLLLWQSASAALPMDCGEPAPETPCHEQSVEIVDAPADCEADCNHCPTPTSILGSSYQSPMNNVCDIVLELAVTKVAQPPAEIFHPPSYS